MSYKSKIEWTESTWNPITGCTKISDGCKNCYAERMANRLHNMGNPRYTNGFKVTLHEDLLDKPLSWKKPAMIFVNSMSDLFHKDVPLDYIQKVFKSMTNAYWHTFQVLTKRGDRLEELANQLNWADNIWMGVTVENSDYMDRIDNLRNTEAKIKFISFEPLLNEIQNVDLTGIDWAIIGGESGPGARPMKEEWVLSLKKQCEEQNVKFYFKQWGGINKKKAGRKLLGRTWDDMPEIFDSII